METVVIVIHLMVVLALVGVVLLQRSEGGGLGIGGGSGFMTARGAANALTRATAILAAAFFATSLGLSLIARYGERRSTYSTACRPRKGGGGSGVLDQLGGSDIRRPLRRRHPADGACRRSASGDGRSGREPRRTPQRRAPAAGAATTPPAADGATSTRQHRSCPDSSKPQVPFSAAACDRLNTVGANAACDHEDSIRHGLPDALRRSRD